MGVIGSLKVVLEIKESIKEFLADILKLELSEDKTKITHLKTDKAKFLGTYITLRRAKEAKVVEKKVGNKKSKSIISQVRPRFHAPIFNLLEKLEKAGFIRIKNKNKMIPNSLNK